MQRDQVVSVILPLYNGEKYIAEALESILSQTYRHIEIIVVNDGSRDRSDEIIKGFGSQLKYVWQENQGTAAARNRGIKIATGDFLAFLDQDDLWSPNKLTRQLAAFVCEPDLDIVFGHMQQFHSPDLDRSLKHKLHCPRDPIPGVLTSAVLITKVAFFKVGLFEQRWGIGEWANWYVRAVELNLKMKMLPEVVAHRRLHAGNKGVLQRDSLKEYAQILKASLDRRRSNHAFGRR